MAKSQQTFGKSEREKKRLKKREDKQKRKLARKEENKQDKGIKFAYVDHNGHLTDTPPDPSMKVDIEAENIILGIPKKDKVNDLDTIRKGKVSFYDSSKGYGFINDSDSQEKYFTHVSGLIDQIKENDKVSFELEKGLKGMNAVKVKLV
jgi:cold shock CspA family protein